MDKTGFVLNTYQVPSPAIIFHIRKTLYYFKKKKMMVLVVILLFTLYVLLSLLLSLTDLSPRMMGKRVRGTRA